MASYQTVFGVLLTFAWGLLLYFSYGRYGSLTIYFALILGLFSSLLFLGWKKLSKDCVSLRGLEIAIGLLVLVQMVFLCSSHGLIYVRDQGANQDLTSFLFLAVFFWGIYCARFLMPKSVRPWFEHPIAPILSLLFLMMSKAAVIAASPAPVIDVHLILTQGTDLFLDFKNPYSGTYPDIYGGAYGYVPTFSYWPGALYLLAPFRFLGLDIRYGLWIADLMSAVFLGLIAQKKFSNSTSTGSINSKRGIVLSIVLLWLTLPISFFILEQAWLDTFIVAGAVALLFCLLKNHFKTAAILAGSMVTVKQYAGFYVFFAIIELIPWARVSGRSPKNIPKLCGIGLLSFILLMLPFILVDPKSFYESTIAFFDMPTPLRMDALTLRTWLALRTGVDTGGFFSNPILLVLLVLGLSGWSASQLRGDAPPRGMVYVVSSFILFSCVFLFGTHSFCNQYYFLAIWPLIISLV